jgi:hypothetical protein
LRNVKNQNLLHFCAINGARDCLFYILKFSILDPNERDRDGELPLTYLIKNHTEESKRNKEMFLWLIRITNLEVTVSDDGLRIKDLMSNWQNQIYNKYSNTSFIQKFLNTEMIV